MSGMSDVHYEIQLMAHELGDDWGQEESTILAIAEELQISPEIIREVLQGDADVDFYEDYDGQPDELTEWQDFDPDC